MNQIYDTIFLNKLSRVGNLSLNNCQEKTITLDEAMHSSIGT